jgi:release factor glutamine methyltransferase
MSAPRANREEQFESQQHRLQESIEFLRDKPEENAASTAAALWLMAAGQPMSAQQAMRADLPTLDAVQSAMFEELVARRLAGVPLAHLTQRQQFMGIEMLAGSGALVPRRETELLARAAIDLARQCLNEQPTCKVVDVCTGSGNVALAIAHHLSVVEVHASDLSEEAVALAVRNAAHLGLDSRVTFAAGDLLAAFEDGQFTGRVDVLTCNPPYINSAKVERMPREIADHEPRLAFDGGALGISILMRLIREAPPFLRRGGWLAFEVGAGQGPALIKRLGATKDYTRVDSVSDEAGTVRVVMAQH